MPRTATNSAAAIDAGSHWREHWCAVAFSVDAEAGRLHRVTIHDEPYVLFRDAHGAVRALEDRCPHRLARLSDGRLRDGQLECLYHGWRFGADGACTHIPQLEEGQKLPTAACVKTVPVVERQGIVWLYAGRNEPSPDAIPTVADLDADDCHSIDFAMDLPYGHEFLIENVLDYAHIHIAHDGVRGGGSAALAGPLAFDISEPSAAGFEASLGRATAQGMSSGELAAARVSFDAQGLVHYRSIYPATQSGSSATQSGSPATQSGSSAEQSGRAGARRRVSGLALYAMPLGVGRCRLLYRAYSNFASLRDRMRPRFWEHGFQCHLLEQDLAVVTGQAANIARTEGSLGGSWLPLKSSDALVVAYRTWLDKHAADRPDYIGLRTRGASSHEDAPGSPSSGATQPYAGRYVSHVTQCRSCRRAVRVLRTLRDGAGWSSFLLLSLAICLSPPWHAAAAAIAVLLFLSRIVSVALLTRLTGRGTVEDHTT